METLDLPVIWAVILALAVLMYVVLDGFDLGLGILFPLAPDDADRSRMMNSVAPVWDGNETWLVLGGGGLFAAFPTAYAAFFPAVYMPIGFMLTALIFRGVAFEFRFKAHSPAGRRLWDTAFFLGSLVAAIAQGLILGTFVEGVAVTGTAFSGGMFDWLTPFSVLTGLSVVAGYTLLGSTWLIVKTDKALQFQAQKWARRSLGVVIVAMVAVSAWTPFLQPRIAERWGLDWPSLDFSRLLPLAPVPVLAALAAYALHKALRNGNTHSPFILSVALFALGYLGLAISIFPYIVPYELTVWDAAAAPSSQAVLLIGVLVMLPLILTYTAYVYWIFRGKVGDGGYHE